MIANHDDVLTEPIDWTWTFGDEHDPVEPSSVFNYHGTTGVAAVRGTGTGWNTETGESTALLFDSDNRFMRGEYISVNGQEHKGTFGFV